MIEFLMPSLGADMEDGVLVEWRKKEGDTISRGDIIAEVETQKGIIEIEIFEEGIIEKLLVKEWDKVPVGSVLAIIRPFGEKAEEKTVTDEPKKEETEETLELHPIQEKTTPKEAKTTKSEKIKISPLARKIAEDNSIDISKIIGTGPDGAITKQDIEVVLEQHKTKKTDTEATATDPTESLRTAIAAAMSKSNKEIPHYYLEKKIDLNNALVWLEKTNMERSTKNRILPVALLIKATAKALKQVPELNASWEESLKLKEQIHIGFVVSLRKGGIIVPAIHNADLKSIDELMKTLNDLIPRAKNLKLRSSELSESTITITSLGEGAADKVLGIIYPPQVAIIGFGAISNQPVVKDGKIEICPIIVATLAGDHRATDGLTGSKFLNYLNQHLQNPEKL
jgi:pyruvate dehydrogenase E2 component (dihydrolipoamide acetyltransferase)